LPTGGFATSNFQSFGELPNSLTYYFSFLFLFSSSLNLNLTCNKHNPTRLVAMDLQPSEPHVADRIIGQEGNNTSTFAAPASNGISAGKTSTQLFPPISDKSLLTTLRQMKSLSMIVKFASGA